MAILRLVRRDLVKAKRSYFEGGLIFQYSHSTARQTVFVVKCCHGNTLISCSGGGGGDGSGVCVCVCVCVCV